MEKTVGKTQRELFGQLATAIKMEYATLPPYLYAFWSLKDHHSAIGRSIIEVMKEEMLHMSLACNVLNAIGGRPKLNTKAFIMHYPAPLPAHDMLRDPFEVGLHKMGLKAIVTFLHIELPQSLGMAPDEDQMVDTIGEFYDKIRNNLKVLPDRLFKHGRQLDQRFTPFESGELFEVRNREDALRAIDEIIEQGEGLTPDSPKYGSSENHFQRFLQIYQSIGGRGSIKKGRFNAKELETTFDKVQYHDFEQQVINVVSDPVKNNGTSASVYYQNKKFNSAYSRMLDALNEAFKTPKPNLMPSIELMFALTRPANQIMSVPVDPEDLSKGYCGPTFEYLQMEERLS